MDGALGHDSALQKSYTGPRKSWSNDQPFLVNLSKNVDNAITKT